MFNGNTWPSIITSALLVCLLAWVIGSVLGALILRSVNEQIEQHRSKNPIPEESEIYTNDPVQTGAS
ncbi:MAG: hypothetical protein AB8C95_08070 [Phycisphaeraceae bacterium]